MSFISGFFAYLFLMSGCFLLSLVGFSCADRLSPRPTRGGIYEEIMFFSSGVVCICISHIMINGLV
jgi:hypothetical protein